MMDSGGGARVDPAYAAHSLPITSWATVAWHQWLPAKKLADAAGWAQQRVLQGGQVQWVRAAGPAAGFVGTLHRLGWRQRRGRLLTDDLGLVHDVVLDPPVVVKAAVHASVRRWQQRQLHPHHPTLHPQEPDEDACEDVGGEGWGGDGMAWEGEEVD